MEACVQVLVKDHNVTIVAECPKLIAANEVDSEYHTCTHSLPPLFHFHSSPSHLHTELSLMFGLMDRIPGGVEPMLQNLESYIKQSGLDDMRSCAEIITTVRNT